MADALRIQLGSAEPILERGVGYLFVVRGNQAGLLGPAECLRLTSPEGTAQTGQNRERIETRGSQVAEDLAGHLEIPGAHGAMRQVHYGEDECVDKQRGPETGERPKDPGSDTPADRKSVQNHQEPRRASPESLSRNQFPSYRPASSLTSQPHQHAWLSARATMQFHCVPARAKGSSTGAGHRSGRGPAPRGA